MIFGEEGVKATVVVATKIETVLYIGLAIFIGITLALTVYAKLLR